MATGMKPVVVVKTSSSTSTSTATATAASGSGSGSTPHKDDGESKLTWMECFACRPVSYFEKLNQLGEGTYGTVFRARDKTTNEIVALKKLRLQREKSGFPLTSVREIKILRSLQHPHIVNLREVVVGRPADAIFLVFDYCEHDMAELLDRMPRSFTIGQIKTIMLQLLSAVAYLHRNFIFHRDLKLSNVLLTNDGEVKLADFGLARTLTHPIQPMTPNVVTLWYRSPEVLFGAEQYHTATDMWAIGCIMGELIKHEPLFPGTSEAKQVDLIMQLLGTPNEKVWPGLAKLSSAFNAFNLPHYPLNNLEVEFQDLTKAGQDLLGQLLTYDPSKRITAENALNHCWFSEHPLPSSKGLFFYLYE